MIHKLILNSATVQNELKPDGNSSVPFLVNFGFLNPQKHYKCIFTFKSKSGNFNNDSQALIYFIGGPLSQTYINNNNSSSYSYSSILGTVHTENLIIDDAIMTGNLTATTGDNTHVYFFSPNQSSNIKIELRDYEGNLFEAVNGAVPDWVLSLSFEEV